MYRFTLPRDLYHGKDALSSLKNLSGKKAVVVVGGVSVFLTRLLTILKKQVWRLSLLKA